MISACVHQSLHGYRRGHELLAGSIRLPSTTADLVTRLSDLSGSIASGWDFTCYVTGYPLAGSPYFAIARTWNDKSAARAGCVLTHTLLIPIEVWKIAPDPKAFCELFAEPEELRNEEQFKKPLQFDSRFQPVPYPSSVSRGAAVDFVRKYFGEGQCPLIWVDCSDPEEVAWSVVRVLWPALREQFSWCTASLQPRLLDSRPIDLQFVPPSAYPRFHKIPRENFIAGDSERSIAPGEPWCLPCAEWIFSSSPSGPVDADLRAFGRSLRNDPTLMRHLFLAKDLSERVEGSPSAGGGLLDVAETLAPKPEEAVEYKLKAARKTVDASTGATPDEALKCLFLVGERLTNEAFHAISRDLGRELTTKVEHLTTRHIREALVMPERMVSRGGMASTPYFHGVVRGLSRCAKESPSDLLCLQDFNKTAPHLISAEPMIASGFLRSLRLAGETKSGREALVGWIAGLGSPSTRRSLRHELLPEVRDDLDTILVEELCRDMSSGEVEDALSVLAKGTDCFAPKKVQAIVQDVVAGPHPEQVRSWAVPQKQWPPGVVSLVAATFPSDALGFSQVVAFGPEGRSRRTALLTAYLDSCTSRRIPGWLKDTARQSADWLLPLLSLGNAMPSITSSVLDRMLPEFKEMPLASHIEMRPSMLSMSGFAFWPSLVDLVLRNAVTAFVEGGLSESLCREWYSDEWALRWVGEVSRGDLAGMLIHPVCDQEGRERAFRWLAFAPHTLYERHANLVTGLCWELVSERRFEWTQAMGYAWGEVIRRVQQNRPRNDSLRMCADVLEYGFDHTGDAVGAAVAAAFYPVYRAVCDSDWTPHEVSDLFGLFDWDKAKELRKRMISAFMGSAWRPGDLALSACEDEQLLRKLVKRTFRQDNGGSYVIAMLNDLNGREDPNIARTVEIVRALASNPDFHEPWD